MDRISRHSQGQECIRLGNLRITSLLFADDVVLQASLVNDLQHALEMFATECEAAGMRIRTSKSGGHNSLLENGGLLALGSQAWEFKYLGVLFASDGRMEQWLDRQFGAASVIMKALYRTVVCA